jgi:hypothetical protein
MLTPLFGCVVSTVTLFCGLGLASLGLASPTPDLEPCAETRVAPEGLLYSVLDKNSSIGPLPAEWSLSVQRVEAGRLLRPVLRHKDAGGQTDVTIFAEKGSMKVDAKRREAYLRLEQADGYAGGDVFWWKDRVLMFSFPPP